MSLSDILGGISSGLSSATGGLENALFGPVDPNSMVDPNVAEAARNQALVKLGLGVMAAPYNINGGLGAGLSSAFTGASQDYQTAMDNAMKHTLSKRDADYQQAERGNQLAQQQLALDQANRSEQEQASQTAQRVLAGLNSAPDKQAYLNLVGNDPEFKSAMSRLGIQAPYTGPMAGPGNVSDFVSQLSTAAQVGAPAAAPIKLSAGDTLVSGSPATLGQPLISAPGAVEYKDTGSALVPTDKFSGKVRTDLPVLPKTLTPDQQQGVFGDKQKDLLGSLAANGVSLPAGMRSRQQIAATLDGLIQKYPDMSADDLAKQIGAGQIDFAGNKGASVNLAKQAAASTAYAQNIEKTFDNLDPLVSKLDVTGAPILNKAFAQLRSGAAPTADTAEAMTYIKTLGAEYGKLRSGSVGNAPLSDTQLKEAESVLANAYSTQGYAGLRKAITNEAANKVSTYNDQLAKLRGAPAIAPSNPSPAANPLPARPPVSALPIRISNAADYQKLPPGAQYIDPNGIPRVKGGG